MYWTCITFIENYLSHSIVYFFSSKDSVPGNRNRSKSRGIEFMFAIAVSTFGRQFVEDFIVSSTGLVAFFKCPQGFLCTRRLAEFEAVYGC